jgi:hypothetical protein
MLLGIPRSARCVQRFDDSLNSAIHITYRISLRSSSMREPRDPLLKVVCKLRGTKAKPYILLHAKVVYEKDVVLKSHNSTLNTPMKRADFYNSNPLIQQATLSSSTAVIPHYLIYAAQRTTQSSQVDR